MIESLPTLLASYITRTQDAVTIARRTCIGTHVVDARIVAATIKAAHWYNLESADQLLGQWISLLHHPDDARLGRVLSLARHCGLKAPTAYVSRIRQANSAEMFRPVMKDTTQVVVDGESYWVTLLSEPRTPPLAMQPEVFQRFAVPDAAVAMQFYGQMSVAELEETLAAGEPPGATSLRAVTGSPHRLLPLALGETVALGEGLYAHRCARCTAIWMTRNPYPIRCGKRLCQTPAWRELARPLRTMQREGVTITPAMVYEAKQQRTLRRTSQQGHTGETPEGPTPPSDDGSEP
jgi:hypothetical protein